MELFMVAIFYLFTSLLVSAKIHKKILLQNFVNNFQTTITKIVFVGKNSQKRNMQFFLLPGVSFVLI